MEGIEIISKDNKLIIEAQETISNKDFLILLKDKLEKIFIVNSNMKKEIILDIKTRCLSNKEILEMFDILESEDKYLITKINCSKKLKEEIVIVRGSIRNGETKVINNSLLLVGNVNRGGKIIVDGNLYVLGKINGDVELKGDMNKIYCESINNSFIKIGGYYGIFTNELLDQVIYVSEKKVVNNAYRIGENYNGKSNSCYIW